ncbi:hypothetical protein VN24_18400 [Paenibacillus beijingensis]|uniref:HAMP domain-containing protein n=2 Tax=Paenibacillus beijingensis TaxID=1126833 RepID=A0A0D5NM10_9BACL|nr:hypothetical protein VN24_18400 [Paenibacillus beijingensis]
MSLRKKINVIHFIAISTCVLFLTVCLHHMILSQAEERAIESSEQEVELIINTVGTLVNSMENFSKLAIVNQTSQYVLSRSSANQSTTLDHLENLNLMYASLNSLVNSSPLIDSVIVQSVNGNIYYSSNLSSITAQEMAVYPNERLLQAKGSAVWVETFQSPFLSDGRQKMMLAVGRKITNMNDGTTMGYVYLNIEEQKMAGLYGSKRESNDSQIRVLNDNGDILSSTDSSLLGRSIEHSEYWDMVKSGNKGYQIFREAGRNELVTFKKMEPIGWNIVYIEPTDRLMKDQWKITSFNIGFGIAALLLALFLSTFLSNRITKPLIRLSQAMTAVGDGNLDIRTQVAANDEIGRLAFKFNEMVGRIQELVQKVNDEEKHKRVLELRLLYSQIKPHFLYNTLEMIRSMTLMIAARDISNTVKALGDFYRTSLNNGGELTTAAVEKKHLESYLFIQTKRYSHIQYRIEFDQSIESCWIPKLLLQPLVENAIYHGLREKAEGAMCEVAGFIEPHDDGDIICFVVKDNGKGMDAEQISRIWSQGPDRRDLSHFGIRNVQERILLRYGGKYGITILPEAGGGVQVQVRLPIQSERNE